MHIYMKTDFYSETDFYYIYMLKFKLNVSITIFMLGPGWVFTPHAKLCRLLLLHALILINLC